MYFSTGVVNVIIRYGKMSDDNQIKFYKYMGNIYFAALYKNFDIKNVLGLCNGKYCNLLSTKVSTKK